MKSLAFVLLTIPSVIVLGLALVAVGFGQIFTPDRPRRRRAQFTSRGSAGLAEPIVDVDGY